jgi:Rrf2 family transcriptional regulator, iron-sulfur cluster assembly transcription factor
MQLSTKGRYAVMALVEIARHRPGECVPLQEVALSQKLSVDYLEQLFMKLRRAGLITSARGPGGGYRLARSARDINIAEIMCAVDEPVKMTRCETDDDPGCLGDERCATHDLWRALGDHLVVFLRGISLRDVVDGRFSKPDCGEKITRLAFDAVMAPRVVA